MNNSSPNSTRNRKKYDISMRLKDSEINVINIDISKEDDNVSLTKWNGSLPMYNFSEDREVFIPQIYFIFKKPDPRFMTNQLDIKLLELISMSRPFSESLASQMKLPKDSYVSTLLFTRPQPHDYHNVEHAGLHTVRRLIDMGILVWMMIIEVQTDPIYNLPIEKYIKCAIRFNYNFDLSNISLKDADDYGRTF